MMSEDPEGSAKKVVEGDMPTPELLEVAGGLAAVYSKRCPGKSSANEDAAAIFPIDAQSAVLAVADGLGGVAAGEEAARLTIDALKSCLEEAAREQVMLRTAILNAIERANQAVRDLALGAATTVAVAEIQGDVIRPYHVGDSMILAVGQRGKIKLQTVSHSPVGYAVEAGVLDAADAMHHKDRHLVSNVVGGPGMRIEVGPARKLAPRDTLLLASDGLCDNLHIEEIVERLRKGPLADAAQRLVQDALQRMNRPADGQPSKPDDLTFVAFRPLGRAKPAPNGPP